MFCSSSPFPVSAAPKWESQRDDTGLGECEQGWVGIEFCQCQVPHMASEPAHPAVASEAARTRADYCTFSWLICAQQFPGLFFSKSIVEQFLKNLFSAHYIL